MRLSRHKLKRIIREEVRKTLNERVVREKYTIDELERTVKDQFPMARVIPTPDGVHRRIPFSDYGGVLVDMGGRQEMYFVRVDGEVKRYSPESGNLFMGRSEDAKLLKQLFNL
jgi:hypothetical protein